MWVTHIRRKQKQQSVKHWQEQGNREEGDKGKEENCQVGDVGMVVRVDPANEKAFITIRAIMNAGATIPPQG